MTLLLLACVTAPGTDASPADTAPADTAPAETDSATTPPECPPGPHAPADPVPGAAPRPAEVWSGALTWTIDFDLLAEAEGYHDCSYTRTYTELVETTEQAWLCPDCDVLVKGLGAITAGYEDCYLQISENPAERVEELGLGAVDGVSTFFRAGNENVRTTALGPPVVISEDHLEVAWEDPGTLEGLRTLTLRAEGRLDRRVDPEILVEDPQTPRAEPYTCGWPRYNPGGPNTDWTLVDGAVFPNARLADQCGEGVSLWDFRGRYVVIDASSPDCGPCQAMAEASTAWEAAMAADCLDVASVTLLNAALSGVNLPADRATREAWAETFGLHGPVLGDLGLGYALFPAYQGRSSGMSLPSWVVLDPEGRLLGGGSGFSAEAGGFDEIEALIRADRTARGG